MKEKGDVLKVTGRAFAHGLGVRYRWVSWAALAALIDTISLVDTPVDTDVEEGPATEVAVGA